MTTYPSHRHEIRFFVLHFIRLLGECRAANDLGVNVCWLLTQIVLIEDKQRYQRPVKLFNDQLMILCAFGGRDRFTAARKAAVNAGWLHYESGSKGVSGTYWVTIPPPLQTEKLGTIEPEEVLFAVPKQDGKTDLDSMLSRNRTANGSESGCATGEETGGATKAPLIPKPLSQTPVPESTASTSVDEELAGFCRWWNSLKEDGLVRTGLRDGEPNKAVVGAWKASRKTSELRQLLARREEITEQLRSSDFAKQASWLTAAKLLAGKNKEGEFIVERLLDGGYQSTSPSKSAVGAGQTYDPTADFWKDSG